MSNKAKLRVVGMPHSGTGYIAKLLQSMTWRVGHETMLENGICAWEYSYPDSIRKFKVRPFMRRYNNVQFDHLIYIVRDPRHCFTSNFNSLVAEIGHGKTTAMNHFGIPAAATTQAVVNWMIGWQRMILSQSPDVTIRVEDAPEALPDFFEQNGYQYGQPGNVPTNVNSRKQRLKKTWQVSYRKFTADEITGLHPEFQEVTEFYESIRHGM